MNSIFNLLNEEQREYSNLANRVLRLTKEEELRFYELHFRVPEPNLRAAYDLVGEYRNQKEGNDLMKLSEEERKWMFRVLDEKRKRKGLHRKEYKYLCFVKDRHRLQTDAETPKRPVIEISTLETFLERFGTNQHRCYLLSKLLTCLKHAIVLYELQHVQVIVGGSFVDEREKPGDIDIALILPVAAFRKDLKNIKSNRLILESRDNPLVSNAPGKKLVDINKLPSNFDDDLYMAYDILTLLGSPAKDRAEDGLKNNIFQSRTIFSITTTTDEIIKNYSTLNRFTILQ